MKRTILVVEDNETERLVLSEFLKDEYSILEASNGENAISILYNNFKDVSAVILDLIMPGIDGYEVLRRIRRDMIFQAIPIIITTSLNDEKSHEEAIAIGANGFVTKPYSHALLLHTIQNAIKLRETSAMLNYARHDRLTGLLTREAFFGEAERLIRHRDAGYYVLACFDVDNFKVINDQYGTEKGDEVLRHIAGTAEKLSKEIGGLTCHFSADRFAVLYPAALMNSEKIANNHIEAMSPECIGRQIKIRIGRYVVDDLSVPVSAMYDRATLAEESIKGRYDTFIAEYNDSMRNHLLYEQKIINDMNQALSDGEFEPWFQPQYNHATGALIGAEALVRWKRDGRFISPAEFVPVFERNGFIYEMDQNIWEQVCRLMRKWLDEGRKPLPVSINISRRDIFHEHFVEVLTGIVKKYDLPYEFIRLEVTESAFAESGKQVVEKVGQLIKLGFVVEIDDFGSGYSSLNTLKDVPASILKLDMKFFENTENKQRSGNIVESIVRMAKWLGMAVIAEGVEEKEQADYLKSIGCYYIQGYFYSKPIQVADYEKLLDEAKREPHLRRLETFKSLDNNDFWNPKSMETLIFNSYVGGACIFEYDGTQIELLRVNEQYMHELGLDLPSDMQIIKQSPDRYLDSKNNEKFRESIKEAIDEARETACELELSIGGSNSRAEFIRATMRVIARADKRYLIYCVIVNQTERKVAEQKRLEAEKKQMESAHCLEVIMSNINGGVSAIKINDDGTSEFVFNNDKYYELYGYTREEALAAGLDVMNAILPEDLPLVMEKVKRLKADKKPVLIDYRIKRPDGKLTLLRANASLMSVESFGDDIITSVVTDITEKRLLEEQLRAVVDNINGGVSATFVRDGAPEYVIVNNRYFEIIGYTKEQFQSEVKSVFDIVHPDDRERTRKLFTESAIPDKQYTMEYRIVRRDGAIRNILCNTNVINLFGIDVPVQLAVTNDITELREAQQKEQEAADKFEAILNHAGNGITAIALRSDKPEFLFVNDKYFEIVGFSREHYAKITEVDMLAPVHYSDREELRAKVIEISKTEGSSTVEYRVITENGKTVWVRGFITITRLAGIDVPVQIAIFSDITAEKTANEQLQFLNSSAHDILAQPNTEIAINRTLENLLRYFDGDRSYVIELDNQALVSNNTYECCAHNIKSEKANLQSVPFSASDYWFDALNKNEFISIENVLALGEERAEMKAMLLAQNISSIIISPLWRDGELVGFLGIDNPQKDADQLEHLRALADYIAILLTRRDLSHKIECDKLSREQMMPYVFSAIMKASTDVTFAKDTDFRYLSCSHAYANVLGLDDENTVVGKTDYELFEKEIADQFRGDDEMLLTENTPIIDKLETIPSGNGLPHYTRVSKFPLRDATGNILGIYGIGRDITERKNNDDRLDLLVNSIPGGIATFTCIDGVRTLEYYNDGFCALFGFSREDFTLTEEELADFIFEDDRPMVTAMAKDLIRNGSPLNCIYRIYTRDGSYKWVSHRAVIADRIKNSIIVNAFFVDMTEQQEERERLLVSEELNRLAIEHSGSIITRYDVAKKTLTLPDVFNKIFVLPHVLENMPEEQITLGRVSPDTADTYRKLFSDISSGSRSGTASFRQTSSIGWRWLEAQYTTVFSSDGEAVSAVISFTDITEKLEKEIVYNKWQQSLDERPEDSYTLFRCNLSRSASFDSWEGELLNVSFDPLKTTFDERTAEYVEQCVYHKDREKYLAFVNSTTMLAEYYRGHRSDKLEYREQTANGEIRWLRLSVDLVEYPNSKDIEVYLMFENIDEKKKEELNTLERSEMDPLTGVLNRAAFTKKMNKLIKTSAPGEKHALMMFDIDNFKNVNDTAGHNAGDKVLTDLTADIGASLRHYDLLGRLGGDEFVIFLKNMPDELATASKGERICSTRVEVEGTGKTVTISMGVAMIPKDGASFEELYERVDRALYRQKNSGKNGYRFVDKEDY